MVRHEGACIGEGEYLLDYICQGHSSTQLFLEGGTCVAHGLGEQVLDAVIVRDQRQAHEARARQQEEVAVAPRSDDVQLCRNGLLAAVTIDDHSEVPQSGGAFLHLT